MDRSVGSGHILALVLTCVLAAVLVPAARLRPGRWVTAASWLLAVVLIGNEVAFQLVQWRGWSSDPWVPDTWTVGFSLPLYVCDAAAFVAGVALVTRRRILVEITWYWALAGTVQGLLTPDHPIHFPSYDWVEFYADHVGVILAALWLVVGLRLHPRPRAGLRVLGITVAFIAAAGLVDALTGGDYDYLHTTSPPGLLQLLGPWPWDIVGATGLGLVLILIFDLPFWPERRRARARARGPSAAGLDRARVPPHQV